MKRGALVLTLAVFACNTRSGDSRSEDTPSRVSAIPSTVPEPGTQPSGPLPTLSASAAPSAPPEPPFEGTAGIIEVKREPRTPKIVALRHARHENYDRVVFEIDGPLPGYHLEYIDKPVRQCGSGNAVPLEGDAWLEVRFTPADAHDEKGQGFLGDREQKVKLGVVREIERTCDFEAVVTHVIGVAKPNRFRVLELSNPARIAVDILND